MVYAFGVSGVVEHEGEGGGDEEAAAVWKECVKLVVSHEENGGSWRKRSSKK